MSFRTNWVELSGPRRNGIDKEQVARFVKTLYSSGLSAARDEVLRDGGAQSALLGVLGLTAAPGPASVKAMTRAAAQKSIALLRVLQGSK